MLDAVSPDAGAVWGDCGHLRRQGLDGGSGSREAGLGRLDLVPDSLSLLPAHHTGEPLCWVTHLSP